MFKIIYRLHALQRMFSRNITESEVRLVLENGETLEDYLNDVPYPSKLLMGKLTSRCLHVVAGMNIKDSEIIIITVYEPDPNLWDVNLKIRRQK